MVTFVSIGTLLLSASTSLAVKLVVALLVEDAVIIGLLEGKPLAVLDLIALFNAFRKGGNGKRVNKVSLALEGTVTFSGGTPSAKNGRAGEPACRAHGCMVIPDGRSGFNCSFLLVGTR